ncbi:histidine--tRNA ligase ['Osedax' symbiont bacterium Rs2_46_30_T18]|nr:histidine--tRNA ligase ['Osedax' symbiont bacterium Rs2_46_30_T18]
MNDILPEQSSAWQYLEAKFQAVVASYSYGEIRTPIVESSELFNRSIGEVTDIVEKEMYCFEDRNGERLALRPEGTASIVRAGIEHGLLFNQTQRFWYRGPMFRYEKPQKGRYRQFQQIGVEAFGMAGADIDAEVILLCASFWRSLGILDSLTLELNSLGSNSAREQYQQALVKYLSEREEQLDEDSQKRLLTNPLRILDSKEQSTQALLDNAPSLSDYLDPEAAEHFATLTSILDAAGISYKINPRLVRGLDYYNKTVFEWTTDKLGAQGTVCAGGRYDGMVKQLGGKATAAVGMAMGTERLLLMLETLKVIPEQVSQNLDLYLAAEDKGLQSELVMVAEQLRSALPSLRIRVHCSGLKNILNKARQTGATKVALLKRAADGQLVATLWHAEEVVRDLSIVELTSSLQE